MTDNSPDPLTLDDPVFLGRAVERLSDLIADQCEVIFRTHGVTIPVKSCSLVSVLAQAGTATATEAARRLGVSHQLVLQKIPKLEKLGLISSARDSDDARKRAFSLTDEGARQWLLFRHCQALILQAYEALFAEVGDLNALISRATAALRDRPLGTRISQDTGAPLDLA